jgi:hypothetical protein
MHGADMMSEFISSGLIRDAIKSRMKLDILIMKDLLEFRFGGGDGRQWPYLLKSLQQFDLI